jgi:hypothetical protein
MERVDVWAPAVSFLPLITSAHWDATLVESGDEGF